MDPLAPKQHQPINLNLASPATRPETPYYRRSVCFRSNVLSLAVSLVYLCIVDYRLNHYLLFLPERAIPSRRGVRGNAEVI